MFFKHKKKLSQKKDDENPFLLSFSDLMVGILAIYILVLIFTLVELEKRKDELRISKRELIESLEGIQRIQNGIVTALDGVVRKEQALALILKEIQTDLNAKGNRRRDLSPHVETSMTYFIKFIFMVPFRCSSKS
jgi:hypothetical protein